MHAISQTIQNMIDNTPGYSLDTLLADLGAGKQDDELLTTREAYEMLHMSRWSFHYWKQKGIFKAYKVGKAVRYKKNEVLQALVTE